MMIRRRNSIPILVLLAIVAGCASTQRAEAPDRTGGLSVELMVRAPGNAFSLYRVETDGSLSFGGAHDATMGNTTWTGTLIDHEITELKSLIEQHGWFAREPESTSPGDGEIRYEIKLRDAKRTVRMKVRGPNEHVEPVRELLDEAARRRFEPILQSLPQPSRQE